MTQAKDSVLFVDDEPNVLEALYRLLIDEPYDVRVCEDPVQAVEEVRKNPPTVVVADFYMPELNGPGMLHQVREIDDRIVRVILTGKPDVTAVLDAVSEGAVYRFILKPWDEDELKVTLHQAFDYYRLVCERNELQRQLDRERHTIAQLEKSNPGISKLPAKDESGAFVLTKKDLPE
jgi:DNA-binding NtrC family response regulator